MASHRVPANQPFYTPGGPTTHFPSNGLDPFTEAKGFAKRLTLTKAGFSQVNWLARFASEASEKNSEMGRQRRDRLEEIRKGFMWDGIEAPAPVPFAALGAIVAAKAEPVAGGDEQQQQPTAVASLKGKGREPSVASTLTPTTDGFPSRAQSVQPALAGPTAAFESGFPGPDPATRPVKRVRRVGPPLGVYEPETHIPQGASDAETFACVRSLHADPLAGPSSHDYPADDGELRTHLSYAVLCSLRPLARRPQPRPGDAKRALQPSPGDGRQPGRGRELGARERPVRDGPGCCCYARQGRRARPPVRVACGQERGTVSPSYRR